MIVGFVVVLFLQQLFQFQIQENFQTWIVNGFHNLLGRFSTVPVYLGQLLCVRDPDTVGAAAHAAVGGWGWDYQILLLLIFRRLGWVCWGCVGEGAGMVRGGRGRRQGEPHSGDEGEKLPVLGVGSERVLASEEPKQTPKCSHYTPRQLSYRTHSQKTAGASATGKGRLESPTP